MPLPLAMMIPFMGIQSAVMAKQFGENFQYGKRRISAMSNEEFNKLTPQKINENAAQELKSMIPSMQESIKTMQPFQDFLIREFVDMISSFVQNMPDYIKILLGINPDEPKFWEEQPPITKPTTPDTIDKLSLTLSQISAANDLVLISWLQNINDYDQQTQTWLLQEKERRDDKTTNKPVQPTPPQQDTKLNPDFVATLTQSDLEKGGSRVRNYKGKIQKWKGTHKLIHSGGVVRINEWISNQWIQTGAKLANTVQAADLIANKVKTQTGSSYVLNFGNKYYLISDDFV